jgi:Na+-transporting NADH:ubiquinone oxidoreductase subunit NqrE
VFVREWFVGSLSSGVGWLQVLEFIVFLRRRLKYTDTINSLVGIKIGNSGV